MFSLPFFEQEIKSTPLESVSQDLIAAIGAVLRSRRHGLMDRWIDVLDRLPQINSEAVFCEPVVDIGNSAQIESQQRDLLEQALMEFHPWRKGPFSLFGVHIDAEWQSDMKWARLCDKIEPLSGRTVLDIGCGNGYYICRMLGQGAEYCLGLEPSQLYMAQFYVIKRFVPDLAAAVIPIKFEEFPRAACKATNLCFDTIFSMGVLYHRKDPMNHLTDIVDCLSDRGELVLETLIIEGDSLDPFIPEGSYAKMPNVWTIPTKPLLLQMLRKAGLKNISVLSVDRTTTLEQRKTKWMQFESLEDFLDPLDQTKTIEGHPSPLRIVVSAKR